MSNEAQRIADAHKLALAILLGKSQNPEIKTVVAAVQDANLWLDENFKNLVTAFDRISKLETAINTANEKIEHLERRLNANG